MNQCVCSVFVCVCLLCTLNISRVGGLLFSSAIFSLFIWTTAFRLPVRMNVCVCIRVSVCLCVCQSVRVREFCSCPFWPVHQLKRKNTSVKNTWTLSRLGIRTLFEFDCFSLVWALHQFCCLSWCYTQHFICFLWVCQFGCCCSLFFFFGAFKKFCDKNQFKI